jgi:hypothetical protein
MTAKGLLHGIDGKVRRHCLQKGAVLYPVQGGEAGGSESVGLEIGEMIPIHIVEYLVIIAAGLAGRVPDFDGHDPGSGGRICEGKEVEPDVVIVDGVGQIVCEVNRGTVRIGSDPGFLWDFNTS